MPICTSITREGVLSTEETAWVAELVTCIHCKVSHITRYSESGAAVQTSSGG